MKRDKQEPCPTCGIGRLQKTGDGIKWYDCGTTTVDNEVRPSNNCTAYVKNRDEAEKLKQLLAEHREAKP